MRALWPLYHPPEEPIAPEEMPRGSSLVPHTVAALAFIWVALWAVTAQALMGTVVWDQNPPEEHVTGYRVFYGPVSRHDPSFTGYPHDVDVGPSPQFALSLVESPAEARFLSVVAYNGDGLQSDYSVELDLEKELTASSGGGGGGGGGCFLRVLNPQTSAP